MSASVFSQIKLSPEDRAAAQDYVRAQSYNRVFLDKMASLGFPAANDEEAEYLLNLNARRIQEEATATPKNRYKAAFESAKSAVQAAEEQDHQETDYAIKLASAMVRQDGDLFDAVLGLRVESEREAGYIS